MDNAVVADLKQFISTVIARQTVDIRQDIQQLDRRLTALEYKVDDGFAGIAEALETTNAIVEKLATKKQRSVTA